MPCPPPAALVATDLVKTYRSTRGAPPVQALDGLSVEVEPGTVFALLGRNGAGKSTAVRVLTTLTRPDSGTALVAGLDVLREPDAVRRSIGLVGQKPSGDPIATGRENLVLAARIHGMGTTAARARAQELLDRFDLSDAADRPVRTWSGGMARKLDVALGITHAPRVLFLDEPTTGLDPEARGQLWAEIGRLTVEEGVTVLLTTHYLDEADRMAARLAIVDAGRVVVEGTPDGLKRELRGDAVQVDVAEHDVPAALTVLRGLRGLSAAASAGRTVRARTEGGAAAVPAVLGALEDAGVHADAVTVSRPSLDDVYLSAVGRSLAGAA
ncbi:ATP-binding cassette domain-containing protein [Blastococcus sp. URHD0036]|uniref:ATP-binding cassette domain-containing protein n=1 Tax=Blastococcus sp. URHD0036 TaxID=1380356 RepID=UPI000495D026|nr:ATP-binding cassette domain-containing protein [Blastococcus sp. URHD0036]